MWNSWNKNDLWNDTKIVMRQFATLEYAMCLKIRVTANKLKYNKT